MSLPQPLHIASAIALVKSKPSHLSVQAYIKLLRQSIRTVDRDGQVHREIDHSALWQKQYDALHSTLDAERNAVFSLQQENDALRAQTTALQTRSKPGRKRKSAEQLEPDTAKKLRVNVTTTTTSPAADTDSVTTTLGHIHRVQILCRGNMWNTKANDLAYHLIQAMEALAKIVKFAPFRSQDPKTFADNVIAVAKSCIAVFYGLKRMESLSSRERFPNHVVHACVCFFDELFTSIEEAASLSVKSNQDNEDKSVLQALAQLAASLMVSLQDSSAACVYHADILEGATYHLIHRLGEATHELLLDGPRNDDIEEEMKNLPLPDDRRLDPTRQTALRAILTAAPLLLECLRRGAADISDRPLTGFARLKLQRTLIDSIFGGRTRGPESSRDILKLPKALGVPPVAVSIVKTEDIQTKTEAFESELWALIGWDILGTGEDV